MYATSTGSTGGEREKERERESESESERERGGLERKTTDRQTDGQKRTHIDGSIDGATDRLSM